MTLLSVEALAGAVDTAAADLCLGDWLAGPATEQASILEAIPSTDARGVACSWPDGSIGLVLLTPRASDALTAVGQAAPTDSQLSNVLTTLGHALGLDAGSMEAVGSPAQVPPGLTSATCIVAAGVFDGADIAATVVFGSGPVTPLDDPAPFDPTVAAAAHQSTPAASRPSLTTIQIEQRLEQLGEVQLDISAELGATTLTMSELLELTPGSVFELDSIAGSPVDLLVNGSLFARADVVVVDNAYGVRIAQLLGDGGAR